MLSIFYRYFYRNISDEFYSFVPTVQIFIACMHDEFYRYFFAKNSDDFYSFVPLVHIFCTCLPAVFCRYFYVKRSDVFYSFVRLFQIFIMCTPSSILISMSNVQMSSIVLFQLFRYLLLACLSYFSLFLCKNSYLLLFFCSTFSDVYYLLAFLFLSLFL